MSTRNLFTCLAAGALCLALAAEKPALAAPVAPTAAERVLLKMIEAVKAQSYEDFLTDADAKLKSQFSRQQFEGICGLYTAPLRKGYRLEYLGQLRQRGAFVYLWKVSVVDGQDESLVKLAMKDGKVSGVWVF
jgi:hypothetical protein